MLAIGETEMISDLTGHTARWQPDSDADGSGAWIAIRRPGRLLIRGQAAAAMALAELEAAGRTAGR
jgi:hypothetical protein